ncbi:peptidoglycan editing factor PgeF [Hydrogenimonas thermophila]|uniref:Purine nucleoside phosphorylase n=1 Tax=Hydrogenimonas thermophila TaxID=223786 RepID=A0A1I5LPB2_9BACT|nr:peptidoglycan editing factor PgeF [Hydrogenimonas thermophila]SFO99100.1 conserved hypothetical protein [Hydrogenimonas thermophila]
MKIKYCFTNRHGGVSTPPYDSLNLAFHVGDNQENVIQNRKILQNKFNLQNIVWMDQVHSDNVQTVSSPQTKPLSACDAIITNQPNIALAVMVADCIPILMFDPKRNIIAAIHAGRNGTFLQIAPKTVKVMQKEFGSVPTDIQVIMGPSIHSCCYEIGDDLASIVEKNFSKNYLNGRMLDLQKLNCDQLIEAQINKNHIKISKICTCCNSDYFSYRKEGTTGRFAGVIWVEKSY